VHHHLTPTFAPDHRYVLCKEGPLLTPPPPTGSGEVGGGPPSAPCGSPPLWGDLEDVLRSSWVSIHRSGGWCFGLLAQKCHSKRGHVLPPPSLPEGDCAIGWRSPCGGLASSWGWRRTPPLPSLLCSQVEDGVGVHILHLRSVDQTSGAYHVRS
jgi:hypothetical protein